MLWRHADFLKLWSAQTISMFGSQITQFLLFGLFAGVWVDRLPRRPILIWSDVGRAVLLATIPVAAYLGALRIEQLYVVGFLVGVLTVFFDVAYMSYLPSLIDRERMVEGNSKLEMGRSVSQVAGPGVAGGLIELLTAPIAILIDSVSFLLSAAMLLLIRKAEPRPERTAESRNVWQEIGDGLGVVLKSPYLRPIAFCTATSNFFGNMLFAVFVLFATRELGLEAGALGIAFSVASVGALAGAAAAGRVAALLGVGPTIGAAIVFAGVGNLFVPVLAYPGSLALPILAAGGLLSSVGGMLYNITQVSLRQAITPHRLQGRMNASMRFVVWGTIPIGALIGGFLGEQIGLRSTMLVGAIGGLSSGLWVLFSPVLRLRVQPAPVD
jgi:MFS family permease